MSDDKNGRLKALLVERLLAIPDGEITETAKRAGMALNQILRLRRGENADVRLSTLERLARGLRQSPASLLADGTKTQAQRQPPRIDPRAVRRAVRKLSELRGVIDELDAALPDEEE